MLKAEYDCKSMNYTQRNPHLEDPADRQRSKSKPNAVEEGVDETCSPSLNGVTDDDMCHICKKPRSGIGGRFCSAPHLASRFKSRIDQLEASLREMIELNEVTGDPDPEITDRARALLPENFHLTHPEFNPKQP